MDSGKSTDNMSEEKPSIAVFTSGGDAPGMNAVVRAVARVAMHYGHNAYAIYEGYQGMVDGGDNIKKLSWEDVGLIIHRGGTVIGSARCLQFRERPGRLTAAKNLIERNITNLICSGGDGSLTGANLFRLEWSSLVDELLSTGQITKDQADRCSYLNLVGNVGSIDNDMVYDGELTIGTDTALHRIVEAIDATVSTASSHQRTFVMEVMGRHCGYLAWAAGVACGADWVLIPEAPPEQDDWEGIMCAKLEKRRKRGQRLNIVIVAEGAIDKNGKAITTDYVRQVIVDRLKHDTRATILGHVQRGGQTSAYDRILGTISGAAAVEKVLRAKQGDPATIVGLKGYDIVFAPLVETVKNTQLVAALTAKLDFKGAIAARGKNFDRDYEFHLGINGTDPKVAPGTMDKSLCILCCGAPAGGMNSAIRAAARYAMNFGYTVYGAVCGFDGLRTGDIKEIHFMDVEGKQQDGGSYLGTHRSQPEDLAAIKANIAKFKIGALLVLGGFEAFSACLTLQKSDINIPVAMIPCTISNNVPGVDFSIGCDTGLNAVADAVDRCKVSAEASRQRVFIVETQGANCGFLAAMGALASGAQIAYTREEGVTLDELEADVVHIKQRMAEGQMYSVILRSETCSPTYDLNFMAAMLEEEGRGTFSVRKTRLGHMCQGLYPSPLDRVRAAQFAALATDKLLHYMKDNENKVVVVGKVDGELSVQDITDLEAEADMKLRVPQFQKWVDVALPLIRQLAKYGPADARTKYPDAVRRQFE